MYLPSVITSESLQKTVQSFGGAANAERFLGDRVLTMMTLKENGIPIPTFFALSNQAKQRIFVNSDSFPDDLWQEVVTTLKEIEEKDNVKFGNRNPLFLTAYSPVSNAKIINIGLNDFTVRELAKDSSRAQAYNAYSRLIYTFSGMVYDIPSELFDEITKQYMVSRNIPSFNDFSDLDWMQITKLYRGIFIHFTGKPFPQDPYEQLKTAILACFRFSTSQCGQKCASRSCFLPASSVFIQRTYFGSRKGRSASCIFNTHDMSTGESRINGMFAENSEMFDVRQGYVSVVEGETMKNNFSQEYTKIMQSMEKLVKLFYHAVTCYIIINERNVFFVEVDKTLFPNCTGLLSASELIKDDFSEQRVINELLPCEFLSVCRRHLLSPPKSVFCRGISGSNGCSTGVVSVSNEDCIARSERGERVILFKHSLTVADLSAALCASAIVTESGSDYSFSALFARSVGIPAAVACDRMSVDASKGTVESNDITLNVGDEVSVENGIVYSEKLAETEFTVSSDATEILQTINKLRSQQSEKFEVLSNVTSLDDVASSVSLGSDGIGFISADSAFSGDNTSTLINLLSDPSNKTYQESFESVLTEYLTNALNASPNSVFTFSLLSHPVTDFLPSHAELVHRITSLKTRKSHSKDFKDDEALSEAERLLNIYKHHTESNPFMGLRGVRLSIRYGELLTCQVNSLTKALSNVHRPEDSPPVRLLLPVTTVSDEVKYIRAKLNDIAPSANIHIGPSFSSSRGCLTTTDFLDHSNFIDINVDELQSTLFGMNETDATHSFLQDYAEMQIFDNSPVDILDESCAGELLATCASHTRTECPIGVSGHLCIEQNGFHAIRSSGATFVVSPLETIPVALLFAAQTP